MEQYQKDRLARYQEEIVNLQTLVKNLTLRSSDPAASVYPLSARDVALFPSARCVFVWDGIAYTVGSGEAVRMTDGEVIPTDQFPSDVRNVLMQGLDALSE